jgi:hypothetical protein
MHMYVVRIGVKFYSVHAASNAMQTDLLRHHHFTLYADSTALFTYTSRLNYNTCNVHLMQLFPSANRGALFYTFYRTAEDPWLVNVVAWRWRSSIVIMSGRP